MQCDLHSGACGQCCRAGVSCSGYRNTQHLRIQNESESVVKKSLKDLPSFVPKSLCLSLDSQARDAFFNYYASGNSIYWDFLKRHYCPTNSPGHLTLAIEAVSLAYLWHQVYSNATLAAAREKYISALWITNKALKSPKDAVKDATLLAALLLDLFEKIINSESSNVKSWTCHVDGALALVRLRGFEQFQDPFSIRVLVRLSSNYSISCIASGSQVPDEIFAIRAFLGHHLNVLGPNWRLMDLMITYANLGSNLRRGTLSSEVFIKQLLELDANFQALDRDMPPSWHYSVTPLEYRSERTFDYYFNTYPDRNVSQGRNALRLVRILLNECLLQYYSAPPPNDEHLEVMKTAQYNIQTMAGGICASVPEYVDCNGAARERLSPSETSPPRTQTSNHIIERIPQRNNHSHTRSHQLDCYTLIFPLYVAGKSNALPGLRGWIIRQLQYISSHFYVRTAASVAQILEREMDVGAWEVYYMLGSYAFAA